MEANISYLTFLADLSAYQPSPDEIYVHVPINIASSAELMEFLHEALLEGLSLDYEHERELENSLKQGYKVRKKQLTP